MKENQPEIVCLCGNQHTLRKLGDGETFTGYCIECSRQWTLASDKPIERKQEHGQSIRSRRTGNATLQST